MVLWAGKRSDSKNISPHPSPPHMCSALLSVLLFLCKWLGGIVPPHPTPPHPNPTPPHPTPPHPTPPHPTPPHPTPVESSFAGVVSSVFSLKEVIGGGGWIFSFLISTISVKQISQRKFRNFNFGLYWKLPIGLAASMFDSRDVLQHRCETWEIFAGRNCAKCYVFSIVLFLGRFAKVGPKSGSCEGSVAQDVGKIRTTPARESDLEVKIVKNWHAGSAFGSWASQNLRHACARERFGNQNR